MNNKTKIHILDEQVSGQVQALSAEQRVFIEHELADYNYSILADLYVAGCVSSTFDVAWQLLKEGRLPEWSGVLALSQGHGRGQLRREWFSPQGNLHVSFRVPASYFSGSEATVLLGFLFCEAFEELGLKLQLKWPNDLVIASTNGLGKIGGILLEEKNDFLIAGLGINLVHLPDAAKLRDGAALPPATVPKEFIWRTPIRLWLRLVQSLILRYKETFLNNSHAFLLHRAEEKLLWRGHEVAVSEEFGAEKPFYGTITGFSERGGLMLVTSGTNGVVRSREIISGSITRR